MQISSRFTIAVHILVCIETLKDSSKVTSDILASSVNTNPVVIRRLLQQLKSAGIIGVVRGSGGAYIDKPLDEISLFDIYSAVECVDNGGLFHFHENPNPECPIGKNIHSILDERLNTIQTAMETEMKAVTVQDIMNDADKLIKLT
ncbi:MAG: Rrf2 family transcriptional regulator [Oscillospiraceae bacterium]|nr:Rrf2 family transcriptional regulator [Oscillospiraceae bacterium]